MPVLQRTKADNCCKKYCGSQHRTSSLTLIFPTIIGLRRPEKPAPKSEKVVNQNPTFWCSFPRRRRVDNCWKKYGESQHRTPSIAVFFAAVIGLRTPENGCLKKCFQTCLLKVTGLKTFSRSRFSGIGSPIIVEKNTAGVSIARRVSDYFSQLLSSFLRQRTSISKRGLKPLSFKCTFQSKI